MIKYLGSKRVLLPMILDIVDGVAETHGVRSVVDLFSGTSRVGHGLKARGYQVFSNDHNAYAATLARCYVEADADDLIEEARSWLDHLSRLEGRPGYFTRTFCEEARFFQPHNGARIDAIRDAIAAADLRPTLEAVLLTSLMEAADRVDSTTGVQMAYLKSWARRAHNDLELRLPALLRRAAAGPGRATMLDALDAAATLRADLAYLDPPYNQHKYLGNYHVWETLVRWDTPEAYGKARKRTDCRERKSAFNSKPRIAAALQSLLDRLDVRHIVLSFSDEGYLSRAELEEMLAAQGDVTVHTRDHPRYVGARIGIYNPSGERVGAVSHLRNHEHLFVLRRR